MTRGAAGRAAAPIRCTATPGVHEFMTTAPRRSRRLSCVTACTRCGTPIRSSWRRTMPMVVPVSIAASGHTTASPSQKARFQMEASLRRPCRSTNAASSKPCAAASRKR
ncbi:hypothetical protein G6F40_016406 [Rhizopus arrhizus]|nr:hypothetical protein G6F40_016406 [Rhizopus arrhizus]